MPWSAVGTIRFVRLLCSPHSASAGLGWDLCQRSYTSAKKGLLTGADPIPNGPNFGIINTGHMTGPAQAAAFSQNVSQTNNITNEAVAEARKHRGTPTPP